MTTTMERSEEVQVPMPARPSRRGRAAVTIAALVVAASAALVMVVAFDDSSTSDPAPPVAETDEVPAEYPGCGAPYACQEPLGTPSGVEESEVPVDQDPLVTRFGK